MKKMFKHLVKNKNAQTIVCVVLVVSVIVIVGAHTDQTDFLTASDVSQSDVANDTDNTVSRSTSSTTSVTTTTTAPTTSSTDGGEGDASAVVSTTASSTTGKSSTTQKSTSTTTKKSSTTTKASTTKKTEPTESVTFQPGSPQAEKSGVKVIEDVSADGLKYITTYYSDFTTSTVSECAYCHEFPCPHGGGEKCPKYAYDISKDWTKTCSRCGRLFGDGHNGTCLSLIDWDNGGVATCHHYN